MEPVYSCTCSQTTSFYKAAGRIICFIRKGNFEVLRQELDEFGYLFIREFHPDNLIKSARTGKQDISDIKRHFFVPTEELYLTALQL